MRCSPLPADVATPRRSTSGSAVDGAVDAKHYFSLTFAEQRRAAARSLTRSRTTPEAMNGGMRDLSLAMSDGRNKQIHDETTVKAKKKLDLVRRLPHRTMQDAGGIYGMVQVGAVRLPKIPVLTIAGSLSGQVLSLRRGELVRWKFEIGQLDFDLSAVFAAAGANGEQTQEQLLEARPARILLFVRLGLCGAHA